MLRTTTLIAALAAVSPAQWIQNPQTGNEYFLTTPMSWQAAQTYADSLGAQLAVVDDADENAWIANSFLFLAPLYLGGTDAAAEGNWTTPYGWPLGYQNWAPNQPDNFQGTEHYLQMWPANATFGVPYASWNDSEGAALLPAVLERPMPQAVPYGAGCLGSNGVPVLGLGATSAPPAPGVTVTTTTSNLPSTSGLAVGFASLQSLTASLAVLGMPGCEAAVVPNGALFVQLPHGGVSVDWQLPLPNLPALRGLRVYMQTLVFDLNANPFGATTSNGLELRLGY